MYTLAVLGATDLLKSAVNKATVCLLVKVEEVSDACKLVEVAETEFTSSYALEKDDHMATLCRL